MASPSVLLISLEDTLISFGVRYLASACRSSGIHSEILFSVGKIKWRESDSDLVVLADWIAARRYTAIGLSLMSIDLTRAIRMTQFIKNKTNVPVIWGGVHAILKPEQSLKYADYVCIGDGEEALPILVKKIAESDTNTAVPNIRSRIPDQDSTSARSLISELDHYPFPDFELQHHFILQDGKIDPMTESIMQKYVPWNLNRHYVISTRGCPNHCAFCCNSALRKLFENRKPRIRSVRNLMTEITQIHDRYPCLTSYAIMDDSFLPKPEGWLEEFCREFKSTGLKFGILLHPRSIQPPQIEMMIDAGLIGYQMGLESGSNRISQQVFHRPETVDEFIQATKILDRYTDRIPTRTYDVIVDNPFETDEDTEATVRVLAALKKPFNLDIFSLTFYPGTELYDIAVRQGLIQDGDTSYENRDSLTFRPSIENRLIWLTHCTSPSIILFFLKNRKKTWGRLLFQVYDLAWEKGLRLVLRRVKHLLLNQLTRSQSKVQARPAANE